MHRYGKGSNISVLMFRISLYNMNVVLFELILIYLNFSFLSLPDFM